MAREYADAGITFVIDDTPLPSDFVDWYPELIADVRLVRVMLVTDGSTVIERIRQRNGPFDHQISDFGAEVMDEYIATLPRDGWTMIDNTNSTLDDTVAGGPSTIQVMTHWKRLCKPGRTKPATPDLPVWGTS